MSILITSCIWLITECQPPQRKLHLIFGWSCWLLVDWSWVGRTTDRCFWGEIRGRPLTDASSGNILNTISPRCWVISVWLQSGAAASEWMTVTVCEWGECGSSHKAAWVAARTKKERQREAVHLPFCYSSNRDEETSCDVRACLCKQLMNTQEERRYTPGWTRPNSISGVSESTFDVSLVIQSQIEKGLSATSSGQAADLHW